MTEFKIQLLFVLFWKAIWYSIAFKLTGNTERKIKLMYKMEQIEKELNTLFKKK